MANKIGIRFHPGVYVKDAIEELGLSQSEFALRTGLSIKNVSTLINGESNVTFEVASKLSAFFDNSIEGWINLQTKYDIYLNEEKRRKEYLEDWDIVKLFNKDFLKIVLGITVDSKNKEDVIDNLRRCFRVGLLKNLKSIDLYASFKSSTCKEFNEKSIIMRNAWVSVVEERARKIECKEFDRELLINSIDVLRTLTTMNPDEFLPKLRKILSDAGVKFVLLPFLSGSNISGVTKWINNEKCVLVAVNDFGKDADKFWFAIFHELGHAIQNHKRYLTFSYNKNGNDECEGEANEFAMNALIDKREYEAFVNKGLFDINDIIAFSRKQNIGEFIVIGRLQRDGLIPWSSFQDRKVHYSIDYDKRI